MKRKWWEKGFLRGHEKAPPLGDQAFVAEVGMDKVLSSELMIEFWQKGTRVVRNNESLL